MYYKACTKHVPVLLCTTNLAHSTSQYYFVLQILHTVLPSTTLYYKACTKYVSVYFLLESLHKVLSSITLYYKACTKHFLVLLCTTQLAQSTPRYYLVLQSLHKAFPCTTLYYKACTEYFPVLLCTTKLIQSTSQYYFVLQSLHKALSCTTLYYKACTEYFPLLLCTRKLAHNTSQNTSNFDTQQALPHSKLLHTARFYYTKNALTHSKFLRRKAFTQRGKESFYTQKDFTHRKLYTQHHSKLLHKEVFTKRSFLVHNDSTNCSFKTGSRRQRKKNTILKHFSKGNLKGKSPAPKLQKSADKSLSQPWCSHSNTIYGVQLQKTIVLRMQPRHQATLMQPLQCF